MTMHGIRLFPIRLMVLSAVVAAGAMAHAQSNLVEAADVAPASAAAAPDYPKRPAELPPKAPRVTCHGDQITISADNSSLDAILALVKGCTGARIEIPAGASQVRSFEELGPGPVREVLDRLLSGTQYNYVIQSSLANPLKVETVLMSMRTNDVEKPGVSGALPLDLPMTPGRRAWQHMQKFDKPDPSTLNADGTPVEADAATPAEEVAATDSADSSGDTPAAQASAAAAPAIAPPVADRNSGADPSKAVQDRISSMQQLFNQRQQMIQQQNKTQSATPNN